MPNNPITKSELDSEIRAMLDPMVEDGKKRMTFETKMKIRGFIALDEYGSAINLLGGQEFLDNPIDEDFEMLGEMLSCGILIRNGFQIIKK
jgi:hypothetical protein